MRENERDSLIYYKEMTDLLATILKDQKEEVMENKDYEVVSGDEWEHRIRWMHFTSQTRTFNLLARWFPRRNEAILKNGALVKFKRKKEAK